jgi:hypothetical protein
MIWMSQDGAPRKNDTDGENDREPDQPHGHPQALPRVGRAEGAVGYPRFAYSKSVSSLPCRVRMDRGRRVWTDLPNTQCLRLEDKPIHSHAGFGLAHQISSTPELPRIGRHR